MHRLVHVDARVDAHPQLLAEAHVHVKAGQGAVEHGDAALVIPRVYQAVQPQRIRPLQWRNGVTANKVSWSSIKVCVTQDVHAS